MTIREFPVKLLVWGIWALHLVVVSGFSEKGQQAHHVGDAELDPRHHVYPLPQHHRCRPCASSTRQQGVTWPDH